MHWYDGKLIESQTLELKINDPGLLYGATVFTTLRVYDRALDNPLTNFPAHCERLCSSSEAFGWELPDMQRLRQGVELILEHYPVVRITIFPDGREWITGRDLPKDLAKKQSDGIIATIAESGLHRSLPAYKTGNYLASWLGKTLAQNKGAAEAILIDSQGNWLETTTGNLWGWQNNCWWTPPLSAGILPGIERKQLIDRLKQQKVEIKEEPWTSNLVKGFEALGYSNCVVEFVPIRTVIQPTVRLEYNPRHNCFRQVKL